MSEPVTEPATGAIGPSYETGSVNVDSLREILSQLSDIFPFQDETSKLAFVAQINSIGEAGNPHEVAATEAIVPGTATTETIPGELPGAEAVATASAASPTAETAVAAVQGENPELAMRDERIAQLERELAAARGTANQPTPVESETVIETPPGSPNVEKTPGPEVV
jgi:hypothetical protein